MGQGKKFIISSILPKRPDPPQTRSKTKPSSPFKKTLWELQHIILDDLLFNEAPRKYMALSRAHLARAAPVLYGTVGLGEGLMQRLGRKNKSEVLRMCLKSTKVIRVGDVKCLERLRNLALTDKKRPGACAWPTSSRRRKVTITKKHVAPEPIFPNVTTLEFSVSALNTYAARALDPSCEEEEDGTPTKPYFASMRSECPYFTLPLGSGPGTDDISIRDALGPLCTHVIVRWDEEPAHAIFTVSYHDLSRLIGRGVEILSSVRAFYPPSGAPEQAGSRTGISFEDPSNCLESCDTCRLKQTEGEEVKVHVHRKVKHREEGMSQRSMDDAVKTSIDRWILDRDPGDGNVREYHVEDAEQIRARLFKRDDRYAGLVKDGKLCFVEMDLEVYGRSATSFL
ncbi:hypothetical protein L198_02937 [Cryptococcus wingfieldii CBS 7118]|uniref:Uncharacterized protein n=1 Tax=Cryptococcus wingfieldii CBS 7118 TaxID=1295528 RepID=A0A1E3JKH2_9TREE|nr:hypothetical protein L198_02937 [Cryptococcus wingfieldii CBS 7118]ODO00617.1 hypothetical protein L198_02937 [Cryptococcus wingfieldii CBS 7118]